MEKQKFEPAVTVLVDPAGGRSMITTTGECMDFLLKRWPGKRGDKHRAALQACMDASSDKKTTATARRAFVAAAREAGVLFTDR